MSKTIAKPPRITCPADLPSLWRALWRNPANSHFLAKMERGHFSNIPVRTVEEAAAEARRLSASGADVYFACAEYASHENRTADNVVAVWDFWLDIDCGEAKAAASTGHATVEIARGVLSKCCAEIGIPEPTFVLDTGGGLHAHWALQTELDPVRWKSIAEKFKKVMAARGLLQDRSRTADIASVMRLPGTLNHKYDPRRPVTLVESSSEYIDTDAFCRAVEEAHARWCSAPVVAQPRATVAMDRPYGPPDLDEIRTALAVLDPDCSEEDWKLRRIAPLARTAREHPQHADALRKLAIDWSSGVLRDEPSQKWREPGGNGLSGEQVLDQVWNRFLQEEDRDGPVITLGTIFHDAQLAGAPPVVIPGDALSLLQGQFFLIRQGGSVWVGDRNVPNQYLKRSDAGLILARVLTAHFPGQPTAPVIQLFLHSPLTIEYVGIYSHPIEEREKQLNVWKGWTLQPKQGECGRIMAFLRDVICDGDEEVFRYLLNWLAHMLQRPEEKPGVMIILLGGQGTGKGTFGHLSYRMLGELYLGVSDLRHVFGKHNDVLERIYLIFFDEFSGNAKIADALKSLVTETHVAVEPKNQPVRQIQSFHRLILASNAGHVKHTDRDDRRDFVLRVSDRHQGDAAYWNALYAEIDGDGTAAFMHELLQRNISGVNIRQRPITKALQEQKLLSLDAIGEWWLDRLHAGYIRDPESGWSDFEPSDDLRPMIEEHTGVQSHRRLSLQIIVRRLTQMCPSIRKAQRAVIPGAVRRRGLELPSLEVARKEFEAYIRHPVDWED